MCCTSPPYWGLRSYGVGTENGEIGLEGTPEEYVASLVGVFRSVREVLADDGTLWLNLGDSYCNSDKWGGTSSGKNGPASTGGEGKRSRIGGSTKQLGGAEMDGQNRRPIDGVKPKDLVGIPWMVAFALRADGWYLRSDIIWHKPNVMPESVTDRVTKSHEYLFLLSKRPTYYYDADAIKEPAVGQNEHDLTGMGYDAPGQTPAKGNRATRLAAARRIEASGGVLSGVENSSLGISANGFRNRRSVWTIATVPNQEEHFAAFPPALVEPCILAGSRPGDVILDPFFGTGTVGRVAERLGRRWIGIELSEPYAAIAKRRTAQRGLYSGATA